MKRLFLATVAIIAIGVGLAIAQNVQQALTGNEAWVVGTGGPAGPGVYTNMAATRGGETYATIPAGTTITQTVSPNVSRVIIIGAITTLGISLPTAPFDGQRVAITCPGGAVTTLTVSAPSPANQAMVGPTFSACSNTTSGMTAVFQYTAPTSWFRVQ